MEDEFLMLDDGQNGDAGDKSSLMVLLERIVREQ